MDHMKVCRASYHLNSANENAIAHYWDEPRREFHLERLMTDLRKAVAELGFELVEVEPETWPASREELPSVMDSEQGPGQ